MGLKQVYNAGIRHIADSGAPTDGTSGTGAGFAGPGSMYFDTATGLIYTNTGTKLSPTWGVLATSTLSGDLTISEAGVAALNPLLIKQLTGTISAANIAATTAGAFGHANGVAMIPAPGATSFIELISVQLFYHFGVAAYTSGGNTTANFTAGAAITGLVSAANFAGAAGDKNVTLYPLAAAGLNSLVNTGVSLVTSAAFVQPGTATGTIGWRATYRVHPIV